MIGPLEQQQRLLIDLISIIHRNVEDAVIREDIYTEFMAIFDDEIILGRALGEDEIYDRVFKNTVNEDVDYDE